MSDKTAILTNINRQQEHFTKIAKDIWDNPQVALQETYASQLLASELERAGFDIEWNIGGMPTAFIASWSNGEGPTLGLLGEYDALPGLSQSVTTHKEAIVAGGPGHGCGHNLYGTACMAAALALKEQMASAGVGGTLRFYGCPAEETLVGKTYMARANAFNDLDAAISWHPGSSNIAINGSSLAMNSFKVNFHGVASHAGAAPELGRSALDAVMLMDVAVNYLREHTVEESRIHSVVTSGGQAPNVVPAYAQVWYFVRAPKRSQVEDIYARMLDIAKGAALMTGTSFDIEFITGCYDILPNATLSQVLHQALQDSDGITFTEDERAFAKALQTSFPEGSVAQDMAFTEQSSASPLATGAADDPLWETILAHAEKAPVMKGSTEVGDVSWICPTGQITTTCWPLGTPGHSWQTVASCGSSIGSKGMLLAAKAMALATWALLTEDGVLARAKEDFNTARQGQSYQSPLPADAVAR